MTLETFLLIVGCLLLGLAALWLLSVALFLVFWWRLPGPDRREVRGIYRQDGTLASDRLRQRIPPQGGSGTATPRGA